MPVRLITDQLLKFRAEPAAVLGQLTQPSFDPFFLGQVRWYVAHTLVNGRDTFRRGRGPSLGPISIIDAIPKCARLIRAECAATKLTSLGAGSVGRL